MRDALVIVDMQKGFVNEHTSSLPEKIKEFAEKGNFATVIGVRYVNHTKSPCYVFEKWGKCMEGSEDSKLCDEIAPLCDIVLNKDTYSCWKAPLKKYLCEKAIDRVVFVGVNTGCCVLHSAFDSYNDLFETIVISDLCGSTSGMESHKAALQVLRECITKERVVSEKQFLENI